MAALSQLNSESKREGGSPALSGAFGPAASSTTGGSPAEGVPKKQLCCACPDTRRVRDNCVAENGRTPALGGSKRTCSVSGQKGSRYENPQGYRSSSPVLKM